MLSVRSHYPRALENRVDVHDPSIQKARWAFFRSAGGNFLVLQFLFLGLFCYIFGALFEQGAHSHNLGIVLVDYDGGAIGRAVRDAYASLQGDSFPSLIERSPLEFPTTADLQEAVCQTKYWAALYVTQGASERLEDALAAEDGTASPYNNQDVLAYVWNEALYAPVVDASVSGNIQLLSDAARVAYTSGNGTGNVRSVTGPAALSVLAEPWQLQSINIQPTSQGSRAIYNTVVIILVLIQEFFYLGTINGLSGQFRVYSRLHPRRIAVVRNLMSLAYAFVGSLCVISTIWAFKAGWAIDGTQFVLSWLVLWLFAHCNFLTLDVFTVWLPAAYMPMALVSWIIFNITSVLLPFDLSPAFYRVGYAAPAHEVYQVLTHIWSGGCNPQLRYALPILFAWELVALVLSVLGVFRRCHFATLAEDRQMEEFQERVDAAVALEMAKIREVKSQVVGPEEDDADSKADGGLQSEAADVTTVAPNRGHDGSEELREQLAEAIERVTTRQRREDRQGPSCNFGPSFNLPFNHNSDDE